ncbi:methyl-accepting chemotaxis protein, partial [Methylophilus rhizosphaerae]
AAAESLVDQANQLADAISQFKLEDRGLGSKPVNTHQTATRAMASIASPAPSAKKFSLDDANKAHAAWKTRLINYMNGKHKEVINHDDAASDHKCDLGKWIYGEGKQHAHRNEYRTLKEAHAHFHESVGEILVCIESRKLDQAKFLLGGDFSRKSKDTRAAIDHLSKVLSGGGEGSSLPANKLAQANPYQKTGTDDDWEEF